MKPFIQNAFVGDFFTALRPDPERSGAAASGGAGFSFGAIRNKEAVVSVMSGEFGIPQLPDLAASLDALLTAAVKLIVLDLSQVTDFSPNTAGMLVNFAGSVEGRGKRLILFRPGQAVMDALSARNLTHLFDIRHSEDELLLALPDQEI